MIEEKKEAAGVTGSGCMCQHAGACEGGMHRFCFRRCCMMKCIIALIILVAVFCAGAAAGHEHHGHFEHGYRGNHMMMGGMMGRGDEREEMQGGYYPTQMQPIQGQYNIIYRTSAMPQSGTSTMAVPAGASMMVK